MAAGWRLSVGKEYVGVTGVGGGAARRTRAAVMVANRGRAGVRACRFQILEQAKLVAPCTNEIWCGDLPKVSARLRAVACRVVCVRLPHIPQRDRAPRRCGGSALLCARLSRGPVCAGRGWAPARGSLRRVLTTPPRPAPRLLCCRQVKLSKRQQEEHMQAALRPTTESFVGYSPQMRKMISQQLAQVLCCRRWAMRAGPWAHTRVGPAGSDGYRVVAGVHARVDVELPAHQRLALSEHRTSCPTSVI